MGSEILPGSDACAPGTGAGEVRIVTIVVIEVVIVGNYRNDVIGFPYSIMFDVVMLGMARRSDMRLAVVT